MNAPVVRRLILKDLYIHRLPLLGLAVLLPACGLLLTVWANEAWGHIGLIVMLNSMIYLLMYLPIGTILNEKKPFLMSLPISPADYSWSKLLGGLAIFLLPWAAYVVALPTIVRRNAELAAGWLPLIAVLMGAFLVAFVLTVVVALVSESTLVTTGVGLLVVPLVFAFFPLLEKIPPRLLQNWMSDRVVWDREVLFTLGLELLCSVAVIAAAPVLQRRKKSFI